MISIIIPAHNEQEYLSKTVESIREQDFKNYEIIIVDDGSQDNTFAIGKKLSDKTIRLERKTGPAGAKNAGAKKASGNLLVFLDADTILGAGVLKAIEDRTGKFDVGTCKIKPDSKKIKHKLMMGLKNKLLCPFGVSNGILFCTRTAFERYGPFDEKMQKREEGTLLRKIKKNGIFVILNNYVISSVRRFEKKGYLGIILYWIKEAIRPSKGEYEVIR